MKATDLSICMAALLSCTSAHAISVVTQASGADAAAIQSAVDSFRASLGTLNPNVAGSFGSGRREINWDGVPDAFAAPNNLPADFFNVNSPRGAVFSTPGTGFQVSANAVNPTSTPVEFGNLNADNPGFFSTFSAQRLFTALDSITVDVDFFIPGSTKAATSSAFGAVFTDVGEPGATTLEFFDAGLASLGVFEVPTFAGDETLSFLGVQFTGGEQISRVRVVSGSQSISGPPTDGDSVAMDDFIYAEPLAAAIPEPSTAVLLGLGMCGLLVWQRRRERRAR